MRRRRRLRRLSRSCSRRVSNITITPSQHTEYITAHIMARHHGTAHSKPAHCRFHLHSPAQHSRTPPAVAKLLEARLHAAADRASRPPARPPAQSPRRRRDVLSDLAHKASTLGPAPQRGSPERPCEPATVATPCEPAPVATPWEAPLAVAKPCEGSRVKAQPCENGRPTIVQKPIRTDPAQSDRRRRRW